MSCFFLFFLLDSLVVYLVGGLFGYLIGCSFFVWLDDWLVGYLLGCSFLSLFRLIVFFCYLASFYFFQIVGHMLGYMDGWMFVFLFSWWVGCLDVSLFG